MGTLGRSSQTTLSRRFLPYLLQPYLSLRSRVPDSRLTPNGRRCRHRVAHRGGEVLSKICGDASMIFKSFTPPLQHIPDISHQSIPAKNTVKRIAIFRALQLGDMLQAIPAIRAIRSGFPNAEITLIGLPWAEFLLQRFPAYLDRFVAFAGFPGITEVGVDPERTARFIENQRAYGYDLAIQMHGSGRISNRFVLALGAKMTVGYCTGLDPEELTLSAPYPENQPEVYRNLGLAKLLACQDCNPRLE